MSVATTDDEALHGRNIGTAGYRRYVVLSLLAVYTLNFIDRQLLGVMAQPIIAHALNISQAEVRGVVSFYHDFKTEPAARAVIKLCRAEACQARGCERIAAHFAGTVAGKVERFDAPGVYAVNFLIGEALGGGGMASRRIDPQGKAYGQRALEMLVPVPRQWLREQ
jgi:hypothetical protein